MRRRCCRCGLYRLDGLRHVCGLIAAAWLLRRAAEFLPTLCIISIIGIIGIISIISIIGIIGIIFGGLWHFIFF